MSRILRIVAELPRTSTFDDLDLAALLSEDSASWPDHIRQIKTSTRLQIIEDSNVGSGLRSIVGIFDSGEGCLLWCEEAGEEGNLSLSPRVLNLLCQLHASVGPLNLYDENIVTSLGALRRILEYADQNRSVLVFEVVSNAQGGRPNIRIAEPLRGLVPIVLVAPEIAEELKTHFNLADLPVGSLVVKFRDKPLAYQPSALRGNLRGLVQKIAIEGSQFMETRFPDALRKEWSELRINTAREDGWPAELVEAMESAFDNEMNANERARSAEDLYESLFLQSQWAAEENASRVQNLTLVINSLVRPDYHDDNETMHPLEYSVKSCQDVVERAEYFFKGLFVTADIKVAGRLDRNPLSRDWASTAWLALVAVDTYVADKALGNFEGSLLDWVASDRNSMGLLTHRMVSYKESESTNANADAVKRRTFPVPESIDSSRTIYMEPHLKIGTKDDFPRIHFFDDTRGMTRKVIIGYFGEHLPTLG